jgi:arginyl-tRNA synthetase
MSVFPAWVERIPRFSIPPTLEFGELSSSIAHEIATEQGISPREIALSICRAARISDTTLIASVTETSGYVNFKLDYDRAAPLIFDPILGDSEHYGIEKTTKPLKVAVEHTSANPSGPLTMGHVRNSILGDALARLLTARGHQVKKRFYVDDVGRQVSILAYGFKLLGEPTPEGKPDTWLGRLYAATNCAVQIETLKKKLGNTTLEEERAQLQKALDEWTSIAAELSSTHKDIFNTVVQAVQKQNDVEADIQALGREYEANEKNTTELVRKVAQLALDGIRASLTEMDITFDSWDWESKLIWDGDVNKVIDRVTLLPFTERDGASIKMNVNPIVEAYSLRDQFHLSPGYEVPSLTLVRSDGSTLYPTRDIAYTLFKFKESDRVINVIASEQSLPQLQIRLALYALGEKHAATNLVHYAYGLVELPGAKMSKRRARFIALDDVIEQARQRVRDEVSSREMSMAENDIELVSRTIALGAIKFAMLNINSVKNLTFTWDRVLSLEKNSSPFINYAYTRAGSILRKLPPSPDDYDLTRLTHPLERFLIFKIAQMPMIFCEAADQLKPEELANYANVVAEKFHEYYEKVDVIHAEEPVKNARALLVKGVQVVLRNSMQLLGIPLAERM